MAYIHRRCGFHKKEIVLLLRKKARFQQQMNHHKRKILHFENAIVETEKELDFLLSTIRKK